MKTNYFQAPIFQQNGDKSTKSQFGFRAMQVIILNLCLVLLGIAIPQASGFASTVFIQEVAEEIESKDSNLTELSVSNDVEIAAPAATSANEFENVAERRFEWHHVFQLLVVAMVVFWGYSLVMSGRHGQGWLVLLVIVGAVTYVGRLFTSVFQEVTSSNEVRDWDDD